MGTSLASGNAKHECTCDKGVLTTRGYEKPPPPNEQTLGVPRDGMLTLSLNGLGENPYFTMRVYE